MKNFRKNQSGFTLIELIVVMIIIGILVLLATPRFIRYVKDANATSLQVDAKVVQDSDLYQNLRAYDEAGKTREENRGPEYTMKDIIFGEAGNITKSGYKHPIFTEGFDGGKDSSKPDFGHSERYDFEKWVTAMAGSFENVTGKDVLQRDNKGELILDSNDKPLFLESGDSNYANVEEFLGRKYAAVSDKVLSSHIRNTRYGVNNFIIATDGIAEGEAYFMGYIEDGDNIMYVSLIPSGIEK